MSKAGPFTRSRSKRTKQVELDVSNQTNQSNHNPAASCQESLHYTQGPSQRAEIGRRLHSDEIVIGLALGSPSQNPLPPLPPDDRDVDIPYLCSPEPPSLLGTVCGIGAGAPETKRKGSKWKSFGGLFGRKHSSSQSSENSPLYQLDQAQPQRLAKQLINQDHLETNALRRKRADPAQWVRDNKEQSSSSQSAPKSEGGGSLRRNSSRRKGLRRRKVEELLPDMQDLHNALSAHATAEAWIPPQTLLRPLGGSLLQVEIPNVELERYSVMFGDVLDSKPQSKPPPSLLSRRKAQLEEIQPIAFPTDTVHSIDIPQPESWLTEAQETRTEELPKPHQRAGSTSSKSSTKSASFSLFPPSPNRSAANKSLPRPSPLSRSTTAPNTTLSPPRPTIHKSKSQERDHVFVIVDTPTEPPSTPHSQGRMPSFGPPAPSANSTLASFFECEEYPGYTFEEDPVTPTAKSAKDAFFQRAFPARKDSMKKMQQPESEAHPRHHVHDSVSTVAAAAEVSIARQISISRRQRQMLVPIAQARQPRRPTLVNSRSTSALRKSHHPTLSDV